MAPCPARRQPLSTLAYGQATLPRLLYIVTDDWKGDLPRITSRSRWNRQLSGRDPCCPHPAERLPRFGSGLAGSGIAPDWGDFPSGSRGSKRRQSQHHVTRGLYDSLAIGGLRSSPYVVEVMPNGGCSLPRSATYFNHE